MNLQGTKGRTRIVPIDPNNQRVDLDTVDSLGSGGTFNQVTVDSTGRVISGIFVAPTSTTPQTSHTTQVISSGGIQAKAGDYGGGTPNWTPDSGMIGLAIDLSNSRIWWFFSGIWN